jgi:hypothetical protein
MVNQYTHSITITATPELLQDENGNVYTAADGQSYTYDCRFEPAKSTNIVRTQDGDVINATWIVYMAPLTIDFTEGDKVLMTLKNGNQYVGTMKRQHNGQFNTRLWV